MHIFYGESNTCKSYLAALTGKQLFETDSVSCREELPSVLPQDIIVVGNRWDVSIEDIKLRLVGKPDIILVNFNKEK